MKREAMWRGGLVIALASMTLGCGGQEPVSSTSSKQTAAEAHASITAYTGPEVCVACHQQQAEDMHGSVHYQQTGPTPFVTNISGYAGERGFGEIAINTYCGSHITSPRAVCGKCHVGNGRFPQATLPTTEPERTNELKNIDCMMCHQDAYKRKPLPPYHQVPAFDEHGNPRMLMVPLEDATGFQYAPLHELTHPAWMEEMDADVDMEILPLEAAQTVHMPTRDSCLRCHKGAAGGNGFKRGDLASTSSAPPIDEDYHMSPAGLDMVCSDCHAKPGHRLAGRGLDLRPSDVGTQLKCENCHGDRPHNDYSARNGTRRDTHAGRVACQTCHIPKYAKGVETEMGRDWLVTDYSSHACNGQGGYEPHFDKASNVTPSYAWYDGTSQVYVLGTVPTVNANGVVEFALPNGSIAGSSTAKLFPMKIHETIIEQYIPTNELIPHSTFQFFAFGSWQFAVEEGMAQVGMTGTFGVQTRTMPGRTYQTINHGVEKKQNAVNCNSCHASSQTRLDFDALGYGLKKAKNRLCKTCHGMKSMAGGFMGHHDTHVKVAGLDCSNCHSFSRPARNLTMP